MSLAEYLRPELIIQDLAASSKEGALEELISRLLPLRRDIEGKVLLRILLERERLGSTGIGNGLAIPHALLEHLGEPILIFGRSKTGISFEALDGKPVYLFLLVIADSDSLDLYLKLLARLSRLLKDSSLRKRLMVADDEAALLDILVEQDSHL